MRVGGCVGYERAVFWAVGKPCSLFHIENPSDDMLKWVKAWHKGMVAALLVGVVHYTKYVWYE